MHSITIFAIIMFEVVIPEGRQISHDNLNFASLWLAIDIAHWLAYGLICQQYLASAIPLTIAALCYVVAYLLCQSQRKTRLTGGLSIDYMMLVIPKRRRLPE